MSENLNTNTGFSEFLNSKSMLTPGAAGALVMVLANSLHGAFPELEAKHIAITLSFLIGGIVFVDVGAGIGKRICFYVLNSLIIFAMSSGATHIGANIAIPENPQISSDSPNKNSKVISQLSFFSAAYAAESEANNSSEVPSTNATNTNEVSGASNTAQPKDEALQSNLSSSQTQHETQLKSELDNLKKEQEILLEKMSILDNENKSLKATNYEKVQELKSSGFFQRW
jgi:hypothetical protein